jgi:hypothetical protein
MKKTKSHSHHGVGPGIWSGRNIGVLYDKGSSFCTARRFHPTGRFPSCSKPARKKAGRRACTLKLAADKVQRLIQGKKSMSLQDPPSSLDAKSRWLAERKWQLQVRNETGADGNETANETFETCVWGLISNEKIYLRAFLCQRCRIIQGWAVYLSSTWC